MIRTLIVDDHPAIRAGLLAYLGSEPGFEVVAAAGTTEEAESAARTEMPDVALLDIDMPGPEDGLGLAQRLKRLPAAPAIVLYSSRTADELRVAASTAGADAAVEKGAALPELVTALRSAARRSVAPANGEFEKTPSAS